MTSSSKTLRAPLALQSSKQESDMPHDSPRHTLPTQKTSIIRRFLRTSTKDSQPPTPLDTKPDRIQLPYVSSLSMPSTTTSEASGGPSPTLSPSTLSAKTASSGSATKVLLLPQPQGSLTRVKQTLSRKINARRVGAEPRSSTCTTSSHSSTESTSSASSASDARSLSSSPRPSTDSDAQPSAADPILDRKQSKLKRWQTRSSNKLKTWLNVQPARRELTTVKDSPHRPELKQEPASEPVPATPCPDPEVHSVEAAIHKHHVAAGSLVVSEELLPLSSSSPPQDSKLQHRRRASEHQPFVYASALQTLRDEHPSHYRPLRSLSRRSLDGPGRIPIRSSSLPRSFSATSSASWARQPLEEPEGRPDSPAESVAPYTTLDNILEDNIETAVMDRESIEAPAEHLDVEDAVESEALSTSCALSLSHPLNSADESSTPRSSPSLNQKLQEAVSVLSAWAATSATSWTYGRTLLDLSVLSRKRRHCKARRRSDISVLVAKMPRKVRRESRKRGGWPVCPSPSGSSECAAGDQTGYDPIDRAGRYSTDHSAKRASIVGNPTLCCAQDEDSASSPLDFQETDQTPSVPTSTCVSDGSYPTQQADLISSCEISLGVVTEMLFSVNPLLKALWQPKSTANALSAISFWSSFHRRESLAV